jgi:hypothetical protein
MGKWLSNFGDSVNNAFYFVIDKIIDLQQFFIGQAWVIGRVVLLIAILSTALNYALTGQGLKENIIKIMKATVFFIVVILAYPRIIGFITSWTFEMAHKSVYGPIASHFNQIVDTVESNMTSTVDISNDFNKGGQGNRFSYTRKLITGIKLDNQNLFSGIESTRKHPQMTYTTVAPAAVITIILTIAGECITYADNKENKILPEFSRILKGLICAFFAILTGVFALLEYLICFLEFMLVASVGVILFPLSIWEGSKFMSEKFIGAIIGFFIKLLFCNLAIFLMLYGFISLFYILAGNFSGTPDQILFIIFTCLLFFYICKSAPALAQSLLTGTPSLSATGAISAVGGAIAAAATTAGMVRKAGSAAGKVAGGVAGGIGKTALTAHGMFSEAGAAAGAVGEAGGTISQQSGAFMSSVLSSAKDSVSAGGLGLARSIMGGGSNAGGVSGGGINPHSWREAFANGINKEGEQIKYSDHIAARKEEGEKRGLAYLQNQDKDNKDK